MVWIRVKKKITKKLNKSPTGIYMYPGTDLHTGTPYNFQRVTCPY